MASDQSENQLVGSGAVTLKRAELTTTVMQGMLAGMVLILLVLVLMFYSGDPLGMLSHIGIDGVRHEKSGVYIDCAKAANRSHPYCQRKSKVKEDRSWESRRRGGGSSAPFSIHK